MKLGITATGVNPFVIKSQGADPIAAAENRIIVRLGNRVRDFKIISTEDGLILQGRTTTYHAKQIAQHNVMEELEGHQILANEIEVL